MDLTVQAVNFSADENLIDFVSNKIIKLNTFSDEIITCSTFMKVDKKATANNKITEIKLLIPGRELFAKKQCDSFEQATDEVVEAIRRQIKRYKGKKINNF
ncbi:MAG: ribosome-associated translation inhibitor RaiA [Crocinitomicaceae bacterium]|nr:ribosome-associated translation inhibitor RaiA [Crocinitomicaceae bacterium]